MPITRNPNTTSKTIQSSQFKKQSANISVYNQDAYTARVIKDIQLFRAWAGDNAKLIIGEFGVPTDRTGTEATNWTKLLDATLASLRAYNIGHYYWATGHAWSAGYNLKSYKKVAGVWQDTYISNTLEKYYGDDNVGVNWASLEFAANIGAPTLQDLQYHASRGVKRIRLPIKFEYLTDFNTTTFNTTGASYYQQIVDTLNLCQRLSIDVMIDIHMYARWNGANNLSSTTRAAWLKAYELLLNTTCKDANNITAPLKDHGALAMFDIMNEPANTSSFLVWEQESQAIVDHLRNVIKYDKDITVALANYSSARQPFDFHPAGPWINDPLAKTFYQAHFYADYTNGNAGIFWDNQPTNTIPTTYASQLADSADLTVFNSTNDLGIQEKNWTGKGFFSNTKGYSSTKSYLPSFTGVQNGSVTTTVPITIPAGATKAVISIAQDNSANITSVAINGTAGNFLGAQKKSFIALSVYSVDLPTNGNLEIVKNASGNITYKVDFFSGLQPFTVAPNVDYSTVSSALTSITQAFSKTDASVTVNFCTAIAQPATISKYVIDTENPINDLGISVGSSFNPTIISQWKQNGERSMTAFINKWTNTSASNTKALAIEFPTIDGKVISPASVV